MTVDLVRWQLYSAGRYFCQAGRLLVPGTRLLFLNPAPSYFLQTSSTTKHQS